MTHELQTGRNRRRTLMLISRQEIPVEDQDLQIVAFQVGSSSGA
ncbi:MAG: hypothetical protein ACI82F_004515, partial [Planctomycetota bacterium]